MLTVFLHQCEGLRVPAIFKFGRLDVQVTVDTNGLLGRVRTKLAQDNGGQGDLLPGWKLDRDKKHHHHLKQGPANGGPRAITGPPDIISGPPPDYSEVI